MIIKALWRGDAAPDPFVLHEADEVWVNLNEQFIDLRLGESLKRVPLGYAAHQFERVIVFTEAGQVVENLHARGNRP